MTADANQTRLSRRHVGALAIGALATAQALANPGDGSRLFGQINRLRARPSQGSALRRALSDLIASVEGYTLYRLLPDPDDADLFWTIEIWPSAERHRTATGLPAVQRGIATCRQYVARFENVATFDAGPCAAKAP